MNVFYHADDFGVCLEQSQNILECREKGKLNSVSLIVTSAAALDSCRLIEDPLSNGTLRCVLHLNLVEGPCASEDGTKCIPHLVDERGYFNRSFSSLLFSSLGSGRRILREELCHEIRAQLKRYTAMTGMREISVDSHRHYHMIPLVWDVLWEVIEKEGYQLRYLRIPVDPIRPVIKKHLFFKVPFVNYVKWALLWILKQHDLREFDRRTNTPVFFGIPFTCRMEQQVIDSLLEEYAKIARKTQSDLELMFHPGAVRDAEQLLDKENPQLVDFYASEYRDREKAALMSPCHLAEL